MNDSSRSVIPETHLTWNLYGSGYDKFGKFRKPERVITPRPGPGELLARIDSVGICYSDVKLLNQGNSHPKLKGRNLSEEPARPGHEISFTVVDIGQDLKNEIKIGDRYAIQPEIVIKHKRQSYGFSLAGGLTQYQIIGPELLDTDQGKSIIQIKDSIGYAEASLLEPLGSVLASFDNQRRLTPKKDGRMWIIGNGWKSAPFTFSRYLDNPKFIFATDINPGLADLIRNANGSSRITQGNNFESLRQMISSEAGGQGFDDIVLLNPQSADQIQQVIKMINRGGLINLVGTESLDKQVLFNPQRFHYDYVGLVGNSTADIAHSYGIENNRSNYKNQGTAILLGGGGPMGQLHLLWAITSNNGPSTILVLEINQERAEHLKEKYAHLARSRQKELHIVDPRDWELELSRIALEITGSPTIDDVILLAPNQDLFEKAAALLHKGSMLNLFAGTPSGVNMLLDLSLSYLGNLQITGSSGLEFSHIQKAYQLVRSGKIDLNSTIAAVGGMKAALEAIRAAETRRYAGKIIIYPQLEDLPLTSIQELAAAYLDLHAALGDQGQWTKNAEEKFLKLADH